MFIAARARNGTAKHRTNENVYIYLFRLSVSVTFDDNVFPGLNFSKEIKDI